ncbi:hypothetical protein TI04_01075 [Achromatium sp. WMS2]|nr:hypothetical protein TI04_01075 [Achromatium sp. WMS2]
MMWKKIEEVLLGKAKDPLDVSTFEQISLIAFLAWVGLGADGLSSSAYGPEEAFIALGHNKYLALYLVIATAVTIFTISYSYNQVIDLFPHGGGGYMVVSKLLGRDWGLVCGSALVIDYILTVSISVAAGVDAVFSFLPIAWLGYKINVGMVCIGMLIWLNMRGLKESIKILVPIFLTFVGTHLVMIVMGLVIRGPEIPTMLQTTATETNNFVNNQGLGPLFILLLTAYSMGGGTYTGIEAVSNGLNQLREPRVQTGKLTMIYMALSLAIAAGGILFLYVLWDIGHVAGKTMNAVLISKIFGELRPWSIPLADSIILITLLSEGLLLFVAAQTGFIGGPNIISNMAADSWMPSRFANLSVRLVRQNGVIFVGGAALAILWYTQGNVTTLVVFYAINVSITFTVSLLAMVKHWWQVRNEAKGWLTSLAINGLGVILTSTILVTTTVMKFHDGAWVTLFITGSFIALCYVINAHYRNVKLALRRLDDLLGDLPIYDMLPETPLRPQPEGPTAVLLVKEYGGLGIHAIFSIMRLFRGQKFKNFLFVSVGQIDAPSFTDLEEIGRLRARIEKNLDSYVDLAQRMGYYTERHYSLGTDRAAELEKICSGIATNFVDPVFFCGKLIFAEESSWTAFLHNQTPMEIQRRLMFAGLNTMVVPVRVL